MIREVIDTEELHIPHIDLQNRDFGPGAALPDRTVGTSSGFEQDNRTNQGRT